jgi:ribosomal protein S18 acetylase RimI-like enzyme
VCNELEKELVEAEIAPKCGTDTSQPDYAVTYPSHLHIDLLPEFQHKGYGSVMIQTLLSHLRRFGSSGVHLVQAASNHRAFAFYTKLGFKKVATCNFGRDIVLAMTL